MRLFSLPALILLSICFLLPDRAFPDCQGCCSYHGGVICRNGVTMCADGSPLSNTCIAKGCNMCIPPPSIACYSNSDCGTDGYIDNPVCNSDDVYQNYRTHTCFNAGTSSSFCSHSDTYKKTSECGEDEYSATYCYDTDVYRDFTDRGCSSGKCLETTTQEKIEECGTAVCEDNLCKLSKSIFMPWLLLLLDE